MKKFLLLVSAAVMLAADLGVISPRRAIQLSYETTRPDFVSFIVELMPSGDTNPPVRLNMTNSLIQVADIPQLPSGRVTMGVRSLFADGEESEVGVFTFNLRRSKPPAPTAIPMGVPAPVSDSGGLTNELRKIREASMARVPPPPAIFWESASTNTNITTLINTNWLSSPKRRFTFPTNDSVIEASGIELDVKSTIKVLENQTGSNVVFVPRPSPTQARIPPPLPDATNQTYGEWIAEREGKRRNE